MTGMIEWGQKSKPQKIPRASNKPPPKKKSLDQKLTPKKSHAEFPNLKNFRKGLNNRFYDTAAKQIWLFFIRRTTRPGYASTTTNLQIVLNAQKNPYFINPRLNQATQKNTCQIFLPQKIPKSKISNPRSSPSLEIRSTPIAVRENNSLFLLPVRCLYT